MSERMIALDALEQEWKDCERCRYWHWRTNVVQWRGNPRASVAIVGTVPRLTEDRSGLPFMGRAGQILDGIVRAEGQDPAADAFWINAIGCKAPPSHALPRPLLQCSPRLIAALEVVRPRALWLIGVKSWQVHHSAFLAEIPFVQSEIPTYVPGNLIRLARDFRKAFSLATSGGLTTLPRLKP